MLASFYYFSFYVRKEKIIFEKGFKSAENQIRVIVGKMFAGWGFVEMSIIQ